MAPHYCTEPLALRASSCWGKPWVGGKRGQGSRQKVQEKEVRRKVEEEMHWDMLCQPPALPGIPSHTLGMLWGSLQAAEGVGRVRGSVLALHTPCYALGHEKEWLKFLVSSGKGWGSWSCSTSSCEWKETGWWW